MKTLFVCHYPLRHRRSIILKLKSETTRAVSFYLMSYADFFSKLTRTHCENEKILSSFVRQLSHFLLLFETLLWEVFAVESRAPWNKWF